MKYIILLCLAVYCAAQVPKPCTSPAQWEARIIQFDASKDYTMFGKISYDELNTRFRIIEEDRTGGQRDYYDTLFLHNVKKEYRLNLKTRQCNTTTLTGDFRPFSIPSFAKFRYEVQVGAVSVAGEHLTAEVWEGEFRNKGYFGDVSFRNLWDPQLRTKMSSKALPPKDTACSYAGIFGCPNSYQFSWAI